MQQGPEQSSWHGGVLRQWWLQAGAAQSLVSRALVIPLLNRIKVRRAHRACSLEWSVFLHPPQERAPQQACSPRRMFPPSLLIHRQQAFVCQAQNPAPRSFFGHQCIGVSLCARVAGV